jgi:hypothetical protein
LSADKIGAAAGKSADRPATKDRSKDPLFTNEKSAYEPDRLANRLRPLVADRITVPPLVDIVLDFAADIRHAWNVQPIPPTPPLSVVDDYTVRCRNADKYLTEAFRLVSAHPVRVASRRWRILIEFTPRQAGYVGVGITSENPLLAADEKQADVYKHSTNAYDVLVDTAQDCELFLKPRLNISATSFGSGWSDLAGVQTISLKSIAVIELDEGNRCLAVYSVGIEDRHDEPICRSVVPVSTAATTNVDFWPCVVVAGTVDVTILPWPYVFPSMSSVPPKTAS